MKSDYFIDVQETVSSKHEFSASSPFNSLNNTEYLYLRYHDFVKMTSVIRRPYNITVFELRMN
jgi:hypothetical protein